MLSTGTICPFVFHRHGKPIRSFDDAWSNKTRSVFDRYDIVNEQDLRDAVRKLAAARTKKGQSRDRAERSDEAVAVTA